MLDDRAKLLLKALVERYIADGQPVGSRTLSRASGLDLSPATIRNVMSDLEEMGLIASPHTSAGRIPTARGYRLFVDTMLTAQREEMATPSLQADQPQRVITNAAQLLSNLSQFVGVVMAPRRTSVFRHIEFLRLSEKRFLVIIVSPDGDVQNRVVFTQADYTQSQLIEASNFLNANYAGMEIDQVRERLKTEVESLRNEIGLLMQAAVQVGSEALNEAQGEVVISGERNLLAVSDFSSDMSQLRRAFELFEQKTQLMRLLEVSSQAAGVRIYIGGESQVVPFEELSIVSSPYEVDGQIVDLPGHFDHFPFSKGLEHWFAKHNRYSTDEAAVAVAGHGPVPWAALASRDSTVRRRALKRLATRMPFRPTLRFLYMYLLRGGVLDGQAGFTYCRLLALYEAMTVQKERELRLAARGVRP